MSEMKWTAGPWVQKPPEQRHNYNAIEIWSRVNGRDNSLICTAVGTTNPMIDWFAGARDYQANAHLIAAAPELYEALEQAVTSMLDSGYSMRSVAVRAGRDALAKARGEKG